jgi:hypothetical protein
VKVGSGKIQEAMGTEDLFVPEKRTATGHAQPGIQQVNKIMEITDHFHNKE